MTNVISLVSRASISPECWQTLTNQFFAKRRDFLHGEETQLCVHNMAIQSSC